MTRGPLEYIVVEFPGNRFNGEIVPALDALVTRKVIRIVDLIFIKKDADGKVEAVELADLTPEESAAFAKLDGEISGLLTEEDVQIVADGLAPNSSAGLLVWENSWAARFAAAVHDADGRVVAHDRIPHDAYDAAVQAAAPANPGPTRP